MFNELNNSQENQNKNTSKQGKASKGGNQQLEDKPFFEAQSQTETKEEINQRIEKLREKGIKQGKRKKIYSVIGITISFLISLGMICGGYYLLVEVINITGKSKENIANIPEIRKNAKNKKNKLILLNEWQECVQDLDCVETQSDCCGCSSGGIQIGINKQYLEEWESILQDKCQNINCITLYSCKQGDVICENNKCKFKESYLSTFKPINENASNVKETKTDSDNDGLYDDEEIQYSTDPNNPDTDGDGYLDGDEVKNGYNPNGERKLEL